MLVFIPLGCVNNPDRFGYGETAGPPDGSKTQAMFLKILSEWNRVDATRLGAALAYYSVLSTAPLLIVAIAVAGWVWGDLAVKGQLYSQMTNLMGSKAALAVQDMVESSGRGAGKGVLASVLGILTLLWGASSVVSELRSSLKLIWGSKQVDTVRGFFLDRTFAIGVVIGSGFLLLLTLLASAILAAVGDRFIAPQFLQFVLTVTSLATATGIFALIIRGIPNVNVPWKHIFPGAFLTAILFNLGRYAIGLYVGKASLDSSFGAAGSLVVFLVWVFYASQILYLGAIVTRVWSDYQLHSNLDEVPEETSISAI